MNNSVMYAWQGAYQWAVLDTDSRKMASRIDAALRAIEQQVRSAIRIDETESVAIEAARGGLAVLRGEWFGGLVESMTGSVSSKRVVVLDLFRTSREGTEWLGSFRGIERSHS